MEQNNIDEINECYLGVLAKIELICDSNNDLVAEFAIGNIEKDILEVAAKYDIYADEYGSPFARGKQNKLDTCRKLMDGMPLPKKLSVLRSLREHETKFIKSMS